MTPLFKAVAYLMISFIFCTYDGHAMPFISQAGNLLANGNFEAGSLNPTEGTGSSAFTSWNQWQQPSNQSANLILSTQQVANPLIEGNYTAHITGNHDDGLFQYNSWAAGTYTLSGWVYVVSGAAHLGVAWNSGHEAAYSLSSTALNQWTFLELTVTVPSNMNGPLVYAVNNSTEFYAEGLWFNAGSVNNSPFQPYSFPASEPCSMILFCFGLVGLVGVRRSVQN